MSVNDANETKEDERERERGLGPTNQIHVANPLVPDHMTVSQN